MKNFKVFNFSDVLSIRIFGNEKIYSLIEEYFPNTLSNYAVNNKVYDLECIKNIPNLTNIKFDKTVMPFRMSPYNVHNDKGVIFSYSQKNQFSNENLVVRNGQKISLYENNFDNYLNVIKLFSELIFRNLLERGYFPIHASAVAFEQDAMLFFGPIASGKSTAFFFHTAIGNCLPLANDIAFIGKENGEWYTYGTSYDITIRAESLNLVGVTGNFEQNKIHFTPKKYCETFNLDWEYKRKIKSISYMKFDINTPYTLHTLTKEEGLKYLIQDGKDQHFNFGDCLQINNLDPTFEYNGLVNDLYIGFIKGNIIDVIIKGKEYTK